MLVLPIQHEESEFLAQVAGSIVTSVRGPESASITRSPYKVIIRALQLVLLYVLASIG